MFFKLKRYNLVRLGLRLKLGVNKFLLVKRNRKKEEVFVLVTVRVYFNYGLRYSLL